MYIPSSSIDVLYDYMSLLKQEVGLCKIPKDKLGTKVAIIGAGAAGLLAAHELLKMGLCPVIYEATARMGGRLYSKKFEQVNGSEPLFAELGAMRIPPASKIFFHYANKLGLNYTSRFPTPGHSKTILYYQNKLYQWDHRHKLPQPFSKIQSLWNLFIEPLATKIRRAWRKGNLDAVREMWQKDIDRYEYMSLYQVLREQSPFMNQEQINIFGELGIGHGAFSPIFEVSFLEILRIVVNNFMSENLLIAEGVSEFINRLYNLKVDTPLGNKSLHDISALHLNLPVVLFDYNTKTKNTIIVTKNKEGKLERLEYPAVIYTGSTGAAHLLNITNKTESGVYLIEEPVREAIKHSPMLAFSKTYICTDKKFWKRTNLPVCILSDEITKSTYFIDYPTTKKGVICLSYSYGMDAMKLHAVDPRDRVTIFKRSLNAILPGIDKYLVPVNNEVINIDWINEKYANGALKIFNPGNDEKQKALYYQFQSVLGKEDRGFYLAGDGISWTGGWVEGALSTALNAVFSVAKHLNALVPKNSPLSQSPNLYHYC